MIRVRDLQRRRVAAQSWAQRFVVCRGLRKSVAARDARGGSLPFWIKAEAKNGKSKCRENESRPLTSSFGLLASRFGDSAAEVAGAGLAFLGGIVLGGIEAWVRDGNYRPRVSKKLRDQCIEF